MELRGRRRVKKDFARDRKTGGISRRVSPHHGARSRVALVLAAMTLFSLPFAAMAQETTPGGEEATTTTIGASTTTTIEPSTSTTSEAATTTTVPDSTTTTLIDQDPLEGDEDDLEPTLLPLPSILFPIVGRATYRDTFGADRDGGSRRHNGTDIIADRGTPIVAVASGVVERLGDSPLSGLYVVFRHPSGWCSVYVHGN
jgi:murein DD-endopeptidase MepM/ murein hydrolase activator NlpD